MVGNFIIPYFALFKTQITHILTHKIMKNLAVNPRTKQGRIASAKMKFEAAIQKYGFRNNRTIALQLAYLNLVMSNN